MLTPLQAAEELTQQQAANGHARSELEKRNGGLTAAAQRYEAIRARLAVEGQQLGSLQQNIQVGLSLWSSTTYWSSFYTTWL